MILIDPPTIAEFVTVNQITHFVWIPDSTIGIWHETLAATRSLRVIQPAREGEAIAIAAGLWLGRARPIVAMQCTGLFEAGDALRNAVHDLRAPLFFFVGCRSYFAQRSESSDTAPVFAEPILRAWSLDYALVKSPQSARALSQAYQSAQHSGKAYAVLIAE